MARNLPARTVFNGLETGKTGRDARGRFLPGAAPGPGRPANPYSRWQAELHTAALAEVGVTDVRALVQTLLRLGKQGNLVAIRLLFEHVLGPPPTPIHPDEVDRHELDVRRRRPTLVDWVSLADEQADRDPAEIPAMAAEEPEDPDPLHPPLRTVLAWAVEELAQAQSALRASHLPPPDPVAGWEAFAESRLEWDARAAVPVDVLFLAYAHWAAARGEPLLPEAQVLAWLTQHGATVHTGPLSQVTTVQGVRVTA